jgi:hypothetical protein
VQGQEDILPLEKFLEAFRKTLGKVVERIGYQIQTISITNLVLYGIETYQG